MRWSFRLDLLPFLRPKQNRGEKHLIWKRICSRVKCFIDTDAEFMMKNLANKEQLGIKSNVVRVYEAVTRKGRYWSRGQKVKILKGAYPGCHKCNIYATVEYFLLENLLGDAGGKARVICRPRLVPVQDGAKLIDETDGAGTALADLIDNSLQAVWSNCERERKLISIEINDGRVSVFDTGPGMDASAENSVAKWGKMGASLHRSSKKQAIGGKPPFLKAASFGRGRSLSTSTSTSTSTESTSTTSTSTSTKSTKSTSTSTESRSDYSHLFFDLFKRAMTLEVELWIPDDLRASPASKGPVIIYLGAAFIDSTPTKMQLGAIGRFMDGRVLFARYCVIDLNLLYPEQSLPSKFKVFRKSCDAPTAELSVNCYGTLLAIEHSVAECEFVTDSMTSYTMLCTNEKNNFKHWSQRLLCITLKWIWLTNPAFKVLYVVKGKYNEIAHRLSKLPSHKYQDNSIQRLIRLESSDFAGIMPRVMEVSNVRVGKVEPGMLLDEWLEECRSYVVGILLYHYMLPSDKVEKEIFEKNVQLFVSSRRYSFSGRMAYLVKTQAFDGALGNELLFKEWFEASSRLIR